MKKPANSLVSIIILLAVGYLAVTFLVPYFKNHPVKPINSGGYREYDYSKDSQASKACASVERVTKGVTTYETCYGKNGKILHTKKIID